MSPRRSYPLIIPVISRRYLLACISSSGGSTHICHANVDPSFFTSPHLEDHLMGGAFLATSELSTEQLQPKRLVVAKNLDLLLYDGKRAIAVRS